MSKVKNVPSKCLFTSQIKLIWPFASFNEPNANQIYDTIIHYKAKITFINNPGIEQKFLVLITLYNPISSNYKRKLFTFRLIVTESFNNPRSPKLFTIVRQNV